MNITIKTTNGVDITQPTEKWLMAMLIAIMDTDPLLGAKILKLVDNRKDAYATDPLSVVRSLGGH